MRFLHLVTLFLQYVLVAGNAHSGRTHIMEKIYFYQLYQLETVLGGDRTFAPGCENCGFDKFVQHAFPYDGKQQIAFGNGFDTSQASMRKAVEKMTTAKYRNAAQEWVDPDKMMPSLPSGTAGDERYMELYSKTSEWIGKVQERIDGLSDDDKKKKAQAHFDASKNAVKDMAQMRKAAYLFTQYDDANKHFGRNKFKNPQGAEKTGTVDGKDIKAENNGGIKGGKYKEIDYDAVETRGLKNDDGESLLDLLKTWRDNRNINDKNTASHLAVSNSVDNLNTCYGGGSSS